MKTTKNLTRLVSMLLALLLCISVLASCSKDKDADETDGSDTPMQTTDPGTDTGDEALDGTEILVDKLGEMKIVYKQSSEVLFLEAAEKLAGAFKSKLGVDMEITSDFIREGSGTFCEKEYEILIGDTTRDEDDALSAKMLAEDYGYEQVGTKIVICGGNDYSTTVAVEDFIYYIINMSSCPEGVLYNSDCNRFVSGKYAISSLKLNGNDFDNYAIVYPAASEGFEEQLATRVSEIIRRMTGKTLEVKKDTESAGEYEILIGKTARESTQTASAKGCMYSKDKSIVLTGDTVQAKANAVELFLTTLNKKAIENKDVSLEVSQTVTAADEKGITTMTFNVLTAEMTTIRKAAVVSAIRQYLPDVLGVQEANPTWMNHLKAEFSDYYATVGIGRENGSGEHTAIFYAKERFELIDSGTKWLSDTPDQSSQMTGAMYLRIFTWAELNDKATGEKVLFVNTHLDIASDEIRTAEALILLEFLENYEDIPVILMGDMNFKSGSSPYDLIDGTCLVSTTDMVESLNAQPWVDWIFVTENCFEVKSLRICNERIDGYYPSDHSPVYAELEFDIPEGGVENNWGDPRPVYPDEYLDIENDDEGEGYGEAVRLPDLLS